MVDIKEYAERFRSGSMLIHPPSDDSCELTEEWLRSFEHGVGKFPGDLFFGPLLRGVISNKQSPSNGRWHWAVRSYPIPMEAEPRNRGQFRTLCKALGIKLKEKE